MLRKIFSFPEFTIEGYSRPDWRMWGARLIVLALFYLVPLACAFFTLGVSQAPVLRYLYAAVAILYAPALLFVRRPKASVDANFKVTVQNPKTVSESLYGASLGLALFFIVVVTLLGIVLGDRI